LFESGLTPVKYDAFRDHELLDLGYGITNIVPRTTATAAELAPAELKEGALILLGKIREYRPRIAAYLGKVVYQYLSGRRDFDWGQQDLSLVSGVVDFVLPNPSGLNRMPIPEQLEIYRELKRVREQVSKDE
ncbi:MAG: mismatch-specific DNA-glycosylase, partial [Bacteroidota bacterium]